MKTNPTQLNFRTSRGGMKSLAFALAAGMAATAFSAEWKIPAGDLDALANAFANCASGDVVTLAKGAYDFSARPDAFMSVNGSTAHPTVITNRLQLSKSNVTLRGEPGAAREEVVINGGGEGYRLLYINGVSQAGLVVSNLTLCNFGAGYKVDGLGDTPEYRGSVINATAQAIRIDGCVIRDCKAGQAALYGTGLVCTDTLLTNCVSATYSGAAEGGTFFDCRFVGNVSETGGGGAASRISASNCWFEANSAVYGGAVSGGQTANLSSTAELTPCVFMDCVFTNNVATSTVDKFGGGAYVSGRYDPTTKRAVGDVLRRCRFADNTSRQGGAVFAGAAVSPKATDKIFPAVFETCTFEGNAATVRGGAAFEYNYLLLSADASADRGLLLSNCTFRANAVTSGDSGGTHTEAAGFAKVQGGGATFGATVIDSTFTENHAKFFGGAVFGGRFAGCTFSSNWTETVGVNYGGGVGYRVESASNCTFVANGANLARVSGAILLNAGTVCDSVFRDNICTNQGFGLVTASLPGLALYDCVFTNSPNNRSGATVDNVCTTARARLARCRFYDNLNPAYDVADGDGKINVWSARDCDAEDCLFTDGALASSTVGASATRCVFADITPVRGVVFDCGKATVALTNCLVRNCTSPANAYLFKGVDLVNCTVVSNVYGRNGFAGSCRLVNSLLVGNQAADGTSSDLHHRVNDDSQLTIRACVYGVNSQPDDAMSFADAGDSLALGSRRPGFNAGKRPELPYYSLRRASPARRKGADAAAFAGTTDLAGNPRVHGDDTGSYTLDVGCYECWMPETGTLLILR